MPERTPRTNALDDGRKLATFAAGAFLVSLFLPWFSKSVLPQGSREFATANLSAFGVFSWIEAALLLVDVAVLALIVLRNQGRRVELPADDGTMFAAAGGWMLALLVIRVIFAKPQVGGGAGVAPTVGLEWGLLVAMAAAGGLLATGLALRAATGPPHWAISSAAADAASDAAPGAATAEPSRDDTDELPAHWRRPRS